MIDPFASITHTAVQLRAGEWAATSVTRHMLDRVRTQNPARHAYVRIDEAGALKSAQRAEDELARGRDRGLLHGIPIAIKDNCFIAGYPCTDGCPAYADFIPHRSAEVVRRLRRAGAVILGSLHLHEGALAEHHPALGVAPVSPFVPGMWPGGSSSGSGVATASGMCFAALGTDTGGSIRYPAALNGLTGLKPSRGRVPMAGIHPLAPSLDTVGPLARNATDARAVFHAITAPTRNRRPRLPLEQDLDGLEGFRIACDEEHVTAGVDLEVTQALTRAVAAMNALGAQTIPVDLPNVDHALSAQIAVMERECADYHGVRFRATPSLFGQLGEIIERGLVLPADVMVQARAVGQALTNQLDRVFARADALLLPVLPMVGIAYQDFGKDSAIDPRFGRFTAPYNLTGHPALTFPVGLAAGGLPIGAQLIGRHGSEEQLLGIVEQFQRVTAWHDLSQRVIGAP